jgi:hypothetical protein
VARRAIERGTDDGDGGGGSEPLLLGWQGEWRELTLSRRDRKALAAVFERYWQAARPEPNDAA